VTDIVVPDAAAAKDAVDPDDRPNPRRSRNRRPPSKDRRRFTVAVTTGLVVALVPYLWILWNFWNGISPLRITYPGNNFYDLQARAMLHGKLSLPRGALNIEGFVHDGHTYTYFGIFPSLIRLPILLLTHRLDGRLTSPSMFVAWFVTGVFCAMLLWRIRIMMRGPVRLGRMEAASYGLLLATMMGGSEWVFLASDAWVYHEDLAWSIALVVASLFTLLGVLEKPTWRRVVASGFFILCASLNRLPTGYACIAGAMLVTAWFALGKGGPERRRWVLGTSLAWLVPVVAATIMNEVKFGIPFGVPLSEQVFTSLNAHRRLVLAHSGGKGLGLQYFPSTIWAYLLNPGGIRLTPIFPYITLPATTPRVFGGAIFDRLDRTASIPASMPLLFLLSCWGLVATFRPRPLGRGSLMRIILFAAAACSASVLVLDFISDRYLADFLPFLLVASAVGMVDLWGRTINWRRAFRRLTVAVLAALTLASIAINLGIASTPQDNWSRHRVIAYVKRQISLANATGEPLTENIEHGQLLPYYGPADKLFVVGQCRALYISNGESFSAFPSQQLEHKTWIPIQRPPSYQHWFNLTVTRPIRLSRPVPIMTVGRTTILMATQGTGHVVFNLARPHGFVRGQSVRLKKGKEYQVIVTADPNTRALTVTVHSSSSLVAVLPPGPQQDLPVTSPSGTPLPFTLTPRPPKKTNQSLCANVLRAG
jgi:hypothetical protein